MTGRWLLRLAAGLGAAVTLGACPSPEADRVRGGDRGADVGNRGEIVRMHGGSVIYHDTPCATSLPECSGPLPLRTARRN